MAKRKFEIISEMFDRVSTEVTSSPDSWRSFLNSACRNFKLRYDEQILVYAQKPEATAVLPIERWNRTFGRWVNRGAKGIAVFEMIGGDSQRLVHYFDISDTHASENSRPVPIWNMRSEYESEVIDTLENTFGYLDSKDSIEQAIISAADNAVEDNTPDYISDLIRTVDDSFLEGLGEIAVDTMYRQLVKNSVAYMMMTRLGINADRYFDDDDFRDVINFNTKATANAIGFATSDIAEMGLTEIARTVNALARQNRIIAENRDTEYTNDTPNERSFDNGRTDLHDAGRLSSARRDTPRTAESNAGTLRADEEELSAESSQADLLQLSDQRNADSASGGRSGAGDNAGGKHRQEDGSERRSDREAESGRSDEVDSPDEQSQTLGAGDRQRTGDIRISEQEQAQSEDEPALSVINDDRYVRGDTNFNVFDESTLRDLPFYGVDERINEIFATTPHLRVSLEEIRNYIEAVTDEAKREEYIRSVFNDDFTEVILADGERAGYKTYENGLYIWKGRYPDREGDNFLHWKDVVGHFNAMRMLGMLQSTIKPLPSQDGQLQLIAESAERNAPAFSFAQEIIDSVLTRGSGVSEGKMRIYEQFQKSLSPKENIAFLKNEYGWGGSSNAINYTGIGEMHDGKGITLSIGYKEGAPTQLLKWNYVEKRIRELIRLDRYLNPKEKEFYPAWLDRQEQLRAERAAEKEIREALYTPPSRKRELVPTEYEYRYSLGATVYIGASEYEIVSFDENRVMLFDRSFPLINTEMTRTEFDAKVRENPMNDHLRVAIQPEKETDSTERDYSKYTPVMQEYFKLRDENPDSIILFQIGAFYEAMGDDSHTVSQALGLNITTRMIADDEGIELCGFPSSRLETNMNMLLDRGHRIGISAIEENGDRKFVTVLPNRDREPVQSEPVGRIEYLNADGTVENSIEYTNATMLERDIKAESADNVSMAVCLYKDADGNVMPHDFMDSLPHPLQRFEIVDKPEPQSEYDILMNKAQELVAFYMDAEFGEDEEYKLPDDLSEINLAYTTTEDEQHEITADLNLVDFRIQTKVDGQVVRTEQYSSLQDIVENGLDGMLFDDLVYVSDEELAPFYADHDELDDVDPAEIRARLAESGIVNGELVDPEKLDSDPFIQQVMADVESITGATGFIDHYYVVDDLRAAPLKVTEYKDRDEALSAYFDLPTDKLKAFGLMNTNKLPGSLDFIQCIDGKDKFIEDYARADVPSWRNPEIDELVSYLKQQLDERTTVQQANDGSLIDQVYVDAKDAAREQSDEEPQLRTITFDLTAPEQDGANQDLLGKQIRLDDRDFKVIKVNTYGDVSLEDLTFKSATGYPIVRIEKVDFVRRALEEQQAKEPITPAWEKKPRAKTQTFDLHPDIPMADRHTFDLKAFELEEVGKKARFRRNVDAIRVLKECEFDNRFATPEEQKVLAQYVGWGGIPEAFDENNAAWTDEFFELSGLLSPEEYQSARESTLTAFYTPPVVISAIYKTMEQMGFKEGNILEPSCGIGNFIGMLPNSMENSRVYGVEIDKISAGIAQQLYQRTSIAAQPFEQADIPDSFFDAVVGNVPFGDFSVADKRYDKHHFLIHDYFFAKSLDKLRPGGVMALVTSKGTMDKESPAVRKYIAQRAELLGAIRLPNNTFKGNAGTEVVSDILILQKRDRIIDIEPDWVHLNTDENGIKMNSYFVDHPDMILGEMKMVSGRFGEEATCEPYENADLESLLNDAISNIHGEITDYQLDDDLEEEDNSIPADPTVRNFSYALYDGKIYFRENSRMVPVEASATAENRIKGLIEIRDSVRRLLELQTEDYPDSDIKTEQQHLNKLYDDYTAKYGLINSRGNSMAFSQDSSYSLLSALEVIDDEGNLERKADMFFKRTVKPHTPVTSVDTASEALAVSMAEKAHVDMDYMEQLTGKSEKEIFDELKGVIFLNPHYEYGNDPSGKYLMADEYLSGNVREKLRVARKSAELYPEDYTVNVQALEKVQPKDLTASEISVRLGATWLPVDIVEKFMYEFFDTPYYIQYKMKIHFSEYTGEWNIENKTGDKSNVKVNSTYGTKRINGYKILEETLNLKDVRIFDYVEDADGKRKAVLNKKETAIAQSKQELIKQGFQDWVWADPKRRERLCKIYNERFNSTRPREYDGSHITFSGMNPEIELRTHQKNAVAHILYGGNTLLAHAVGAGKTFEMVAAAMESKRLGLCTKSLFVVPNHLTEQWAAEFLQLYPAANVLVATKKDFETKNRKRFCGRIATGDYDAIIIGHSQFEKIPMSVERQKQILEQQLQEITDGIIEMKANRGERFSIKQLEKSKKGIQAKLKKLNDQSRKDDVVTFEELGVDRLFIDESHYYKNLFLFTKMRNVGGIAQTEAQKSSDLFMKCRYLDELTGGRGAIFATGTPISNSMVELYTIQRYLQYETLQRNGLQHFDSWASTFGETITAVELTPEGTGYRAKTRFAKFYNLPELMAMFKEVADIQTADMLNLPTPEAHYHNVAVKPSDFQKDMVEELGKRAEKIRNGMVDASVDNMLKITNDGRKLALDQRMLNPMLPDFDGSKVNACVDNIFQIWQDNADKKSAQLVFCDLSTPKSDAEFSVYTDIRRKLIERGVPESEIRFIHEANTEVQKQELFKKVRRGEVRVLLGSTQKMGAGTNVQNKLIALHDIDCPWRPSDLEQRSGRIIRQGNENSDVHIYRYVTEQTFDSYLYQLVEGKQKFASQIMTSKSPVRSAEDIDETALSYAEIKMLATGNPHIKEKMDLDIQVQKLKLYKSNYLSEKYALEDRILKYYPQEIARLTASVEGLAKDLETAKVHPKEVAGKFVGMVINGFNFTEKAETGQVLIESCKAKTTPEPTPLGEYRGFKMELAFDTFTREYEVKLKGHFTHSVSLGTDVYGNITRIDNAIDNLETRLNQAKADLENTKTQLETAKVEVEKPFAQEEELKQKMARLNELNALLNVDKRENEIVGGEPDEGEQPTKNRDRDCR